MKKNWFIVILILSFSSFEIKSAKAQWVETNGPTYPYRHPKVTSFAVSGNMLFVGTKQGVFESVNNGESWKAISSNLPSKNVKALAAKDDDLFAGIQGKGIFLLNNHGKSWTAINNGLTNKYINEIVFNKSSLFVETRNGVFISKNDGESWSPFEINFDKGKVGHLAVKGKNLVVETEKGKIFYSPNNSLKWRPVNLHLSKNKIHALSLIVLKNHLILAVKGVGLFRSSDDGRDWTAIHSKLRLQNINSLIANGNDIYAATGNGNIYHSINDGKNWSLFSSLKVPITSQVFNSGYDFIGTLGNGIYRSIIKKSKWTSINKGLTENVVNALVISGKKFTETINNNNSTTPTNLDTTEIKLIAGTNDGIFYSVNRSKSWLKSGLLRKTIYSLASDKESLSKIFKSSSGRSSTYVEKTNFIFAGTDNGIFRSTDNGKKWNYYCLKNHVINTIVNNEDPITVMRKDTKSGPKEIARHNDFTAGTNFGIYQTVNDGKNWIHFEKNSNNIISISPYGIFACSKNSIYELLNPYKGTWTSIKTGFNSNRINSITAYMSGKDIPRYIGTNNGVFSFKKETKKWKLIYSGLKNKRVTSFAIYNVGFGLGIFAGTAKSGVFRSIDAGKTWTKLNIGLANKQIYTLYENRSLDKGMFLYAGTGNGVAVLNLNPSQPPSLTTSVKFTEPSGNHLLDAGEKGKITVQINNSGSGNAQNIKVNVKPENYPGLSYPSVINMGSLPQWGKKTVTIPIKASHNVKSSKVSLLLKFTEANGFQPSPVKVVFSTKAFQPPKLIVSDVGVKGSDGSSVIEPGRVVTVTARIQNTGHGKAKDVHANVRLGENVFLAENSDTSFSVGELDPGQYKDIKFKIYTNNQATGVPVFVSLKEHYGKYGTSNLKLPLAFNKPMAKLNELVVQPKENKTPNIQIAKGLSIGVDTNIPQRKVSNPNAVALILAISRYQDPKIPVVKYAKNDARVLREYLIKTLGFSPDNILPRNPDKQLTYGQIQTYIKSILPSYLKPDGSSDLFVYYTGNGAPNTNNHDAYMVPWDADPNYVNNDNAYNMKQFYRDIEKLNARRKIIVVDACFSGQDGNGVSLIKNASPALLKINNPLIASKNTVIFQSSGAEQVSNWYKAKRHGMFTYFFLKGLQGAADLNGDGKISAKEMIKYIDNPNNGLPYYSNRLYQRPQDAQLDGDGKIILEKVKK